MAAGPTGPQGPIGSGDPTMPAHPGANPAAGQSGAPPVYAPAPEQRFERDQPYPPGYGQAGGHDQGPSMQDRASEAAHVARRAVRTPETKEFFKTSEFFVWALTILMVVIAGAIAEEFDAGRVWLYVTVISAAYVISRGIAKAGTGRGNPESHWGHDHR